MKFSVEDFFSKCEFLQFPADLVTLTEEILNGKFHFCALESALILNIGKHRGVHYSSKTYFKVRSDKALCFDILKKARYIQYIYIYMYIYIYNILVASVEDIKSFSRSLKKSTHSNS